MLSLIKYTIITICAGIITMCWFAFISNQTNAQDLLESSFWKAKTFDYVVNIGNNRQSVGGGVLKDWYRGNVSFKGRKIKTSWSKDDPIIIRVSKWLLEIVVILWVPMLIYGGIRYIVAAWDEWAQKSARTLMFNVVIGIIIALSSLALVTLVSTLFIDSRFAL